MLSRWSVQWSIAIAALAALVIFLHSPAYSQSSGGLGALKKSSSQDTSTLMRQAFNSGDYDRAIILASQAIVNDIDNAGLYTFRCRAHMAKKDYDTALRDCDHAIRLDPGAVAAYNNRAYIWIERKQLDRAIADANKAMELAPADRYFALYNRAYASYLKGRMKDALADINAAIATKDSSASLFTLRAKIQLALDMPKRAVEDAQTALRLSPKQPAGHLLLGDALRKMGAHRQAIEAYDRALALKPGYPDALAARAESLAAQGEGQPTLPKPKAAEGLSSGVVRESVQVRAPDISVTQDVAEKPPATAVSIATAQKPAAPIKAPDTAVKPPDVAVIGEKAAQPDTRVDEPVAAPGGYQQSEYAATGDQYWPTPPPEPAPRPMKTVAPGAQAMLDDPCGQIDLPEDDDEEAPVPPGGAEFGLLKTSLAQNIGSITKSRWAASVSAGRNAMEKLLGPLPAEEESQFQRSWALMADYPSKKVVAYLDRLNPLLVEFLALTQATESMLAALEMAKYEAQMAAAYENEEGAREAMENIGDIVARLKSLNQQVSAVSSAVAALGEPPNPLEDKCRARRRAKKAFDMFKQGGGAWVLVKQRNDIAWRMEDERITKNEMKFGPGAARSFSLVPSQFIGKDWPDAVISWDYSWTPPPRVIADQDTLRLLLYIRDAGVEYGDGRCWSKIYLRSPHHLAEHVVFDGMLRGWKEEYKTGESYQTLVTETMRVGGEHKRLKPQDPKGTQTSWIPQETSQPRPWPKLLKAQPGWTMTLEVVLNSAYLQGKAYYDYKFDPDAQSPSPMADPTKGQKSVAQAPATPTEEERQMASLKEKMDFHKNNIALLEGDLARYRQMMDGAKDEASRMAIQNIITGKMADLQAEHDAITTLATGEFTRTRTAWDEMVWAQMDANSRELAGRIQEANYRRGMLGRLINLLPPIEREDTRLWAQSQLGPGEPDPEKLKKVARIIAERGQGFNQADAARYDEVAANQQVVIDTLENYQTAATVAMYATPFVSGGSTLALAYGLTQGGVTGYQTGGLLGEEGAGWQGAAVGAVTTAARFWSPRIDYAITFYEGYSAPGAGGEKAGVMGGLKNVATTFIQRKVTGAITQKIVRYQAQSAAAAKQARLSAWRDAQRKVEFRQEREYGKAMVEEHQRAYVRFKELKKAGAPPAELHAAEQKLMDQTAAIKQAPHAKGYLKFNATPEQQAAYNSTSRLHTARVVRELKTELGKEGFDPKQLSFKPIRNAGATSPGMDLDLAMYSSQGNKVAYTDPKTGKTSQIDIYTANATVQKIFNKVYARQSGGRTAHASWQMVTSGKHLEAYSDPNWLRIKKYQEAGIDPLAMVDPKYAADAARVTEVKAHEIRQQGGLGKDNQNWEIFRGTAKDIGTKVLPNIQARMNKTTDPKVLGKLKANLKFYTDLQKAMETANHDPVAAQQQIKGLTGYDAVDVVHMTSAAIESMGKWK